MLQIYKDSVNKTHFNYFYC